MPERLVSFLLAVSGQNFVGRVPVVDHLKRGKNGITIK